MPGVYGEGLRASMQLWGTRVHFRVPGLGCARGLTVLGGCLPALRQRPLSLWAQCGAGQLAVCGPFGVGKGAHRI